MQTSQTPSPPHYSAGEIPFEAWRQVEAAHELCETLAAEGRGVRFRRDRPRPWAELTSTDGTMTVVLRPSDVVDTARLADLAACA